MGIPEDFFKDTFGSVNPSVLDTFARQRMPRKFVNIIRSLYFQTSGRVTHMYAVASDSSYVTWMPAFSSRYPYTTALLSLPEVQLPGGRLDDPITYGYPALEVYVVLAFPPYFMQDPQASYPARFAALQLRQVSVAEEYRADLARKLLETHSPVDDEDCLEDRWRRVKEAMLSAFRIACPAHLTRINGHWISSRSTDLIAARKSITSN
ncbi:hypothetical protein CLF_112822 [Clonorchis sinensis]|uniref:Uncharacterized protein n=1 Tax=Clonorchis sinensis TaxID=79923 RepID=G7YX28_CLOSI|nr:hypothetical protein CLF_112822 [Clonorchis sinensis]